MMKKLTLQRGEPIEFTLPDGSMVEVLPCTAGQYREALALEDGDLEWEEQIVRQCASLAGAELAECLTPAACAQVVRAVVCQYHGIDPNDDARLQKALKKKALLNQLLGVGMPRVSASAHG